MTLENPAQLDFTVYRGVDLDPIVLTVRDNTGAPVNLLGWSVGWGCSNPNIPSIALITYPQGGQVTLQATRSNTANWPRGEFPWDSVLLTNSNVAIGPFVFGTLTVKESYTPIFP